MNYSFSACTELPSSSPSALALPFGNAFHVLIESALPLPVGELPLLSELMAKEKEVRNNLLRKDRFTPVSASLCILATSCKDTFGVYKSPTIFSD